MKKNRKKIKLPMAQQAAVPVFNFLELVNLWNHPVAQAGGEKHSPFANRGTFGGALKKKGYEYIGSGVYSTVYAKPGSTRVIKVTKVDDGGWYAYCKWAETKGYAGTWAPKVYAHKSFPGKGVFGEPFVVTVVERMKESIYRLDSTRPETALIPLIEMHGVRGNTTAGMLADLVAPGVARFTTDLKEKFGACLDIHGGNIMVREDDSICFTDPVACYKEEVS